MAQKDKRDLEREMRKIRAEIEPPKRRRTVGDILESECPNIVEIIGERAANLPISETWDDIDRKHADGTAGGVTTRAENRALYLAQQSALDDGRAERARAVAEFKRQFPEWQATARAEWGRQLREGERLSTVDQMARFIIDGLDPGAKKPTLSMVIGAISNMKPKRNGAKRKPANPRNRHK